MVSADLDLELDLDETQMCAWAEALGALLQSQDVLLLRGEMGTGKTTFTRALAAGLGVARPDRVCSPTYTLCMIHPGRIALAHVDLFRLGELSGVTAGGAWEALGLEHDELPGPGRVLVVEWSELWGDPPTEHLQIEFRRRPDHPTRRTLSVVGVGDRWTTLALPRSS